ncbi:MAG: hypothetical protein WKF59_02460 [Chitinophagaceae bacterium]
MPLLTQRIQNTEHKEWLKTFKDFTDDEYEKIISKNCLNANGEIKMAEVIYLLDEITKGEAIIVTDVGQHQMVTSRYYHYKNPRTNVTSGDWVQWDLHCRLQWVQR